ncbi:LLM class flavin-dependent oxidoreductase [Deinococcus pimensis]|uniref:LLM class flavin-dependent oxidoreductase n=1 Tax=Deinococcus pimensis TaxID=309888 RepID=UPI0004811A4B|nr:LLM class flavin-dependent oxidoreductase [Deinococcus pimensis]
MPLPLSVLDLAPVSSGDQPGQALRRTLDLARAADRLGYTRYWLAEHHNTGTFASTATELLIALVARETTRIRVGSGGIMLPNHAPLRVAENFKTLEAFYPGRIDLALGRAPGTDGVTALALRRSAQALRADDFPEQIHELRAFAGEARFPDGHPFARVRATPDGVPLPPLWLLGSSTYGAALAARLGLGFAFAYHFSPDAAGMAMRSYREQFVPSEHLARPHAILAVSVMVAETRERAEALARTQEHLTLGIRGGRDLPLVSPEEALTRPLTPQEQEVARYGRALLVHGTPDEVRVRLEDLAGRYGADELMITSNIHDHEERVRSYELLAGAFGLPARTEGRVSAPA